MSGGLRIRGEVWIGKRDKRVGGVTDVIGDNEEVVPGLSSRAEEVCEYRTIIAKVLSLFPLLVQG